MGKKARILISLGISLTFATTSGALNSPANAVGEIITFAPLTNSAYFGSTDFNSQTNTYVPLANSRTIKITLESDVSVNRTITTNLGSGLQQISFNPLLPDSTLISNAQIISVNSSLGGSATYPNGSYKVTFSWQYSLSGIQTRTQDVLGVTFHTPCSSGSYSAIGSTGCTLAEPGTYVATSGQTAGTNCPVGKYADVSGLAECKLARAGHFVDQISSWQDVLCPPNTFQDLTGQNSCNPCPTNYTADSGSDASSDCIAPVVSQTPTVVATPVIKALPTLAKGKKMKINALATQIEMSLPARSKATAKVAKSSKRICRVSGTSIKALRKGSCVVTVKVKPRKGSATTKATTITVN